MSTLQVLLVDDAASYRSGMRWLLETSSKFRVVGEADDGERAVEVARRTRPDVVLMDLKMPNVDGVEGTRRLSVELPETRVLALTTFAEDELVFSALAAGAAGYLLKDAEPQEVFSALLAVGAGRSWLTPSIASKVVDEFARIVSERPVPSRPDPALSRREIEVLRVLATGANNRTIATRLFISEGTVKNHLTRIFEKLEVNERVQAALRARDLGLV